MFVVLLRDVFLIAAENDVCSAPDGFALHVLS